MLERFYKLNIAFCVKTEKKTDVDVAVIEDWKEQLPTLIEGYNPCDVFKDYLCWKMIISQIVSSEAQVNNCFIL